jgi:hypothetical protein
MFSRPSQSRGTITSLLLVFSISTSFAQNDDSDFVKNRNSSPFWHNSLKRDIQGFRPGLTESEVKHQMPSCEVSAHKFQCPVSSGEHFELSLTEQTKPRLVKDVTYIFPAGGATSETMAKNVMAQFAVGKPGQCLPSPQGLNECSQWQLEDGSYMQLAVGLYRSEMVLYLSTPKWIADLEKQTFETEQGKIPPRKL